MTFGQIISVALLLDAKPSATDQRVLLAVRSCNGMKQTKEVALQTPEKVSNGALP